MAPLRLTFVLVIVGTYVTLINGEDKLKIEVTQKGSPCDIKSKNGDKLRMHYTGKLNDENGKQFDSSRKADREPFEFTLGQGNVIAGWDQGLKGMCVGEKRKLTIPASLGYGNADMGPIPGGSTLYFETELLKMN